MVAQDEILDEARADMQKVVEVFRKRLSHIRTGRASVSLLDGIRVDYYGTPTPLNQVASLAAPEARLITISPWEKSMLGPIEKEILKSDLGLTPQNDGKIIRIPIPELTGERRKELVRLVNKEGEAGKVAIRNTRREYNETIKMLEKEKEISEDESRRLQAKIQEITDEYIKKLGEVVEAKRQEIEEI